MKTDGKCLISFARGEEKMGKQEGRQSEREGRRGEREGRSMWRQEQSFPPNVVMDGWLSDGVPECGRGRQGEWREEGWAGACNCGN